MEEKKKCHCCGEEILAVAKKCKHCGEWFEKTTIVNKEETTVTDKSSLNYQLLAILCYVAMFFVVISGLQDIVGDTEVHSHRKWSFLITIAQSIPQWLTVICEGSLMVFLIMSLRKQYMRMHQDKPLPFTALLCLLAGAYLFSLIATFIPDYADEDIFTILFVVVIPLTLAVSILHFIVGFQLRERLKGASMVGIAMIILAIVPIITGIVELGIGDDKLIWTGIVEAGVYIFFLYALKEFYRKTEIEEQTNN